MAKDYGDYKNQRHHDGRKIADGLKKAVDEGMFFGASPKERQELRQTKDKKGIRLEDLDLNAIEREKFGADKKVGENLRLIDMAMGAGPPAPPSGKAPPAPPAPPKAKRRKTRRSLMSSWTRLMGGQLQAETDRPDGFEAAPDFKGEGVVVAKPRVLLERLALLLALIAFGGAAAGWLGAAGDSIRSWSVAEANLSPSAPPWEVAHAALCTWEGLALLAGASAWFGLAVRSARQLRGGALREALRVGLIAGWPTACTAAVLFWASAVGGRFAAPRALAEPLIDLLARAPDVGIPVWLTGALPVGALAALAAWVARRRQPRFSS